VLSVCFVSCSQYTSETVMQVLLLHEPLSSGKNKLVGHPQSLEYGSSDVARSRLHGTVSVLEWSKIIVLGTNGETSRWVTLVARG